MDAAPRTPLRGAEPSGFTLFLLFFGSMLAAGLVGIWLWNSNASVREGRAFGTANQIGTGGFGGAQPSPSPATGGGADSPLAARGQQLASEFGCVTCHDVTGQAGGIGPTWKGLAGSQRPLASGQTVTADDEYLKESILNPDAKIVRNMTPGIMAGAVAANLQQIQQGDNLDALVAYVKSLK